MTVVVVPKDCGLLNCRHVGHTQSAPYDFTSYPQRGGLFSDSIRVPVPAPSEHVVFKSHLLYERGKGLQATVDLYKK